MKQKNIDVIMKDKVMKKLWDEGDFSYQKIRIIRHQMNTLHQQYIDDKEYEYDMDERCKCCGLVVGGRMSNGIIDWDCHYYCIEDEEERMKFKQNLILINKGDGFKYVNKDEVEDVCNHCKNIHSYWDDVDKMNNKLSKRWNELYDKISLHHRKVSNIEKILDFM